MPLVINTLKEEHTHTHTHTHTQVFCLPNNQFASFGIKYANTNNNLAINILINHTYTVDIQISILTNHL